MTTTVAQLETRIRQRSDNEYTDGKFATSAEILSLINVSHKQLFGLLVEAGLHSVTETIYTIPVDGSLTYALPTDCYAVSGCWRLDGDQYIPLGRHDQRTFPRDTVETVAWSYRTHGLLETAVIELFPRVDSLTYKTRYVGVPADFTLTTDTIDGVIGWEEWIVLDIACKLLFKEKQWEAVDRCKSERELMTSKIQAQAWNRDLQNTGCVKDVRGSRSGNTLFDEFGYLPGGHRNGS